MPTTLVLFDRDLRLHDHAPLAFAAQRGAVVPLYVFSPEDEGDWPTGAAQRAWLARSLPALDAALRGKGAGLHVRTGRTLDAVAALFDASGADAVYWHRRYTPAGRALDEALRGLCRARGVEAEAFEGTILHDPEALRTRAGEPYRVYSPFYKALMERLEVLPPLATPETLKEALMPDEAEVSALANALRPSPAWDAGFCDEWTPGEAGAQDRLRAFVEAEGDVLGLDRYDRMRGRPDVDGSSRLSPHLALGELSIRTLWHAVEGVGVSREKYRKELGWREFAYHLLWHFPQSASEPLQPQWARLAWRDAPDDMAAWQRGQTGFPYVDAAMRQLWTTGWMHNRTRMMTGAFFTKHLLQPWQNGARWFWDTLVDADLANNTLGWQWVAGTGADAAPYFRVLNPTLQSQKHDPDGAYVRRYVPELAALPTAALHAPSLAPPRVLAAAGVRVGDTYPAPILDPLTARRRALDAYARAAAPSFSADPSS